MLTNLKKNNSNIADIVFQKPKKDNHGNRTIDFFNKITNVKLQISSPFMISWGIEKNKGNNKHTLSQMFPTEEYSSTNTNDFLLKLQDIQDTVLDYVINNSVFFFDEKLNPDVIKNLFYPILKPDKNRKYPPTIRPEVDCFVQGKGL
jgi:hypothetical protein